ncbi:DUF6171 family protein [Singulisphaera sp. PoT]|uniref:DUF6171 family protein n=1 Tax=Singulisphaera sp. PoT TaxID=3411797 RepID=UPI003BF53261
MLEQALGEARRLGDRALEVDVLGNLTQAAHTLGDLARAYELVIPVLDFARQTGDRYGEKLALDRLGQVLLALGDRDGGLAHLEQAWSIAAELGDVKHEADLLWRAGIEHAELGNRDQAIGYASAAVDRLRRLGNPAADWYAHHLANYRSSLGGEPALLPSLSSGGFSSRPTFVGAAAAPAPGPTVEGPGLLRMAITAAKAMVTFVGSGFKTATAELYRERLATCATCEFHTGVRCRVCGCITAAKARLLHERCPANRWTA